MLSPGVAPVKLSRLAAALQLYAGRYVVKKALAGSSRRCVLGSFVTTVSSTAGLIVANWLSPKA
jgi:hypothetical protein